MRVKRERPCTKKQKDFFNARIRVDSLADWCNTGIKGGRLSFQTPCNRCTRLYDVMRSV